MGVMQIIDRYTDKFSDGDYLQLCDKLKGRTTKDRTLYTCSIMKTLTYLPLVLRR